MIFSQCALRSRLPKTLSEVHLRQALLSTPYNFDTLSHALYLNAQFLLNLRAPLDPACLKDKYQHGVWTVNSFCEPAGFQPISLFFIFPRARVSWENTVMPRIFRLTIVRITHRGYWRDIIMENYEGDPSSDAATATKTIGQILPKTADTSCRNHL